MKLKRFGWFVLLVAHALLLNGCATSAVWRTGSFTRYCEPANPPELRLFHSPQKQDVFVEYSESREDDDSFRRRAYWLRQNEERLKQRRQPRFVSAEHETGLVSIPVLQPPAVPACTSRSSVNGGVFGKEPALPCATTMLSPSRIT